MIAALDRNSTICQAPPRLHVSTSQPGLFYLIDCCWGVWPSHLQSYNPNKMIIDLQG